MKVLAISPSSVTAINRNVYVELKHRGWDIELVIPQKYVLSSGKTLIPERVRSNDPPIHFVELKGINPRLFYFPSINNYLQDDVKLVILENDPVSYMAFHIGRRCATRGITLFTLSCENLTFEVFPTIKRRGFTALPGAILKNILFLIARPFIDTVFTISNDGTKIFKEKGFKKVVQTPLGFDPSVFFINEVERERIRSELGLKAPVIAYFGRIVEEKGVDVLINALSMVKHLNWVFMLDKFNAYASPYQSKIYELIKSAGIQNKTIQIDANHYQIASYMNAADVVVVPSISTSSWKEQYGRILPEAMACGKIVFASASGTLPELLGENGVLFAERDAEGLSLLLKDFLVTPNKYLHFGIKAAKQSANLSLKAQADIIEQQLENKYGRKP